MYIEAITPQKMSGMLRQEEGSRPDAVHHQGDEDHGDRRIPGNPQRQEGDERRGGGCVVGRLGRGYALDRSLAELLGMFGETLLHGIGGKGADDRPAAGQHADEETE